VKARRALRQGRRVRARVTVTGRSRSGAVLGRARTTIRLRR
jgi:hypothetical protein